MTKEEEKIAKLTRLGREVVIKYGTYDMTSERQIIQDHPFYASPDEVAQMKLAKAARYGLDLDDSVSNDDTYANDEAYANPIADDDATDLANQILSSNFKVGMSQADVDAFLLTLA